MTHGQAKLTLEEQLELKHLLGALLTLLSFWSLLSLEVQAGWLLLPAIMVILAVLLRPSLPGRIPETSWRYVGPLLLFVIGADFLLHVPEFIPSLVRMMVWLLLYRNLAPRRQREDMQLILLCLFCVILSGVMTVSLLFAFQILLFTPLAMALLFLLCLLDRGEETAAALPDWRDFRWRQMLHKVWAVLDFRVLFLGSLMFGFVVIVSTLLFILTPRFNLDQAIPFLEVQSQPMTGFSDEVRLGDVSEVIQDRGVAARIDVPALEALGSRPYWRMLVLDRYSNGSFRMSTNLKRSMKTRTSRELRARTLSANEREGALWTFYLEGGVSRFLPVPGDYAAMRFQVPQQIDYSVEPRIYGLDAVTQSVFSFQIEDLHFNQSFQAGGREISGLSGRETTTRLEDPQYPLTTLELAVPEAERAVLAGINEEVVGSQALSVSEYSDAVTAYLWQNFDYSLRPDGQLGSGPENRDEVVSWLQSGSRGHCELFASAFVLLAREAGIPARLIVGFAGGSWNSVEDYFVLRHSDAHAWVEVYDASARAWLRVDPTPRSGSSDPTVPIMGNLRFETGWMAWVDSLRIQWYRRIVNFEQKDQVEMALSLKEMATEFSKALRVGAGDVLAGLSSWIAEPLGQSNFLFLVILLLLLCLLYLVWLARFWLIGLVSGYFKGRGGMSQSRRRAGHYLRRLRETQADVAAAEITEELEAIRYGPEVSPAQAQAVFAMARRLLRGRSIS